MNPTFDLLKEYPLIAAVRESAQLGAAIESKCKIIFLLSANLNTIEDKVKEIGSQNKKVFVHLDLMEGLRRDRVALDFLINKAHVDGIITTHSSIIRAARDMNVPTIQRLFLLDSVSVDTGIQSVNKVSPDFVELLPGTIPTTIRHFSKEIKTPIIAGGLINTSAEVQEALVAGAVGVSTGNYKLWNMNF